MLFCGTLQSVAHRLCSRRARQTCQLVGFADRGKVAAQGAELQRPVRVLELVCHIRRKGVRVGRQGFEAMRSAPAGECAQVAAVGAQGVLGLAVAAQLVSGLPEMIGQG